MGSNANLGIYPHWCLGNINKCSDGITVSFFIKPKKADETSPEAVIITSGGHSFFSEGFYLLQKNGDQYEFGISKQDKVWRQKFRLLPNLWTNIFASWNDSAGLKLYVDGYLMKRDDPEKREYEDDSFDPFSEIVIGLDQEGLPINSTNLFDIDNLVIFNSIKSPQEYSIGNHLIFGLSCIYSICIILHTFRHFILICKLNFSCALTKLHKYKQNK